MTTNNNNTTSRPTARELPTKLWVKFIDLATSSEEVEILEAKVSQYHCYETVRSVKGYNGFMGRRTYTETKQVQLPLNDLFAIDWWKGKGEPKVPYKVLWAFRGHQYEGRSIPAEVLLGYLKERDLLIPETLLLKEEFKGEEFPRIERGYLLSGVNVPPVVLSEKYNMPYDPREKVFYGWGPRVKVICREEEIEEVNEERNILEEIRVIILKDGSLIWEEHGFPKRTPILENIEVLKGKAPRIWGGDIRKADNGTWWYTKGWNIAEFEAHGFLEYASSLRAQAQARIEEERKREEEEVKRQASYDAVVTFAQKSKHVVTRVIPAALTPVSWASDERAAGMFIRTADAIEIGRLPIGESPARIAVIYGVKHWYLVDMERAKSVRNGILHIDVEKEDAGYIIGKGGKNIQKTIERLNSLGCTLTSIKVHAH